MLCKIYKRFPQPFSLLEKPTKNNVSVIEKEDI